MCSGSALRLGLFGPPSPQGLDRGLAADGTLVHTDGKQVLVCAAEHRSRGDAEDLGDLVAVQLGANRVELLLRHEPGNTQLEVVVDA